MDNLSIIKSMLFCLSVPFLTPFPWTNLRARYIYWFLFTWWRYWDHELIGESLFKKFYLSHSEKCPSKHAAICPSKYELCVLSSMKLRNKSSPLQLAPKPTHTQRENIMGPKDLSIEGAVVPGLLLCSRTKQKPRNNSALYWKVFSQRPQIYR